MIIDFYYINMLYIEKRTFAEVLKNLMLKTDLNITLLLQNNNVDCSYITKNCAKNGKWQCTTFPIKP